MAVEQRGAARDIAMKVAISSLIALAFGSNHSPLLMSTDQVTAATFSVVSASNSSSNTSIANPLEGPLRILASNPRYFTDGSGKAIYLAGSHTWEDMLEVGYTDPPPAFDFRAYLNFLHGHKHNFFRLWTCALPHGTEVSVGDCYPLPWARTGPGNATDGKPRFDLTKFNQAYFDRLRSRIMLAAEQGIYVSVMLFDGYAVQFDRHPDDGYPLDEGNNINGVAAPDTTSQDLSKPAVTAFQDAYVRKVIETVNDLDNVLYEIANEAGSYSTEWQYHMIDLVKHYEVTMPKQHPVGMTYQYKGGTDATLYDSPADWVSPSATLPPEATGTKVIINDTDHSFSYTAMQSSGYGGQRAWAWENFARGNNVAFMDPYLWVWPGRNAPSDDKVDPYWEEIRNALGDIRSYADRIDLASMAPQHDLVVGGGFCLASPGTQYLVFLPSVEGRVNRILRWFSGNVLELKTEPGTYSYEWFDPSAHSVVQTGTITVAARHTFAAPFSGAAVLWLHKRLSWLPVENPGIANFVLV
jgi:hypothetical protein